MFLVYLLGVVLFFSFLANFAFRKIFKSLSWVDRPDGIKKLHKNDIPLSGGISFISSLIFAVLIFDFFAGVNFNLSWNGFFVGDSIKQDNSLNQNLDKKIDLIGNDSFEIEVVDINENSQAVVVVNKKTFEIFPIVDIAWGSNEDDNHFSIFPLFGNIKNKIKDHLNIP